MKKYINVGEKKIKLIIVDESTVVDEKNRRVIHKITWRLKSDPILEALLGVLYGDFYHVIVGTTKGVAICSPEDTFDPELGKKLARAKAESNAYTNASRRLLKKFERVHQLYCALVDQAVDFKLRSNDVVLHNNEYQDNLTK